MAQTTQNVSNLQINTVVHTKDANNKLRAFKKLLSSFKNYRMPNITASITGMTGKAKANANAILTSQNQTVKALERQSKAYNGVIKRQRKSLELARKIKETVGSTRPSGGGGGGRAGSRGSGGMGPNVPPSVRNNNRLNTAINRSETLAASRGLDINTRVNGRSIRDLGREFRNSGRSAAEYRHELRRINAELRRGRVNANGFGESMRRLRTYVVATTASMTLFAAGRDIVKTGLQIEGLEVALISITGSTKKAAEEYKFFRSVVNETGVDMIAAAKGFKQLTASAKGTKLEGNDVHDIFSEVSKQAAILGMTGDDTNGVFRAFSQIISKAKVSAEELNSQLGDRMFGAVQIAAKGMQMTTKDLLKFVSTGQLTAEEFIPKFMTALKELNKGFKDAAELSKQVAFTKFNNGLTDMKDAIFKGGLGEGLKDLANGFSLVLLKGGPLATFIGGVFKGVIVGIVTPISLFVAGLIDLANWLTKLTFGKTFEELEQSQKQIISMTGSVVGLIIATTGLVAIWKILGGAFLVAKIKAIALSIWAATKAVWAMNAALLANPLTWIVLAIIAIVAAIGYAVYKIVEHWDVITLAASVAADKIGEVWDSMVDSIKDKWASFVAWLSDNTPNVSEYIPDWLTSDNTVTVNHVPTPTRLTPEQSADYAVKGKTRQMLGLGTTPYNYTGNPTKVEVNVNVNDGAVQGLVEATVDQREGVRMESFKNNTTK